MFVSFCSSQNTALILVSSFYTSATQQMSFEVSWPLASNSIGYSHLLILAFLLVGNEKLYVAGPALQKCIPSASHTCTFPFSTLIAQKTLKCFRK